LSCVPPFNPATSLLAGMNTAALQTALAAAQQAYIALSTGAKGESYSYTQGDGTKSVTYTRANLPQLASLIQLLQSQLGIVSRVRSPIRFRYR
jgi:hypothetical protein